MLIDPLPTGLSIPFSAALRAVGAVGDRGAHQVLDLSVVLVVSAEPPHGVSGILLC